MNIKPFEKAVARGIPFPWMGTEGVRFEVPHHASIVRPPRIARKRTSVVVHNNRGFASVLSLLTITSLTSRADVA